MLSALMIVLCIVMVIISREQADETWDHVVVLGFITLILGLIEIPCIIYVLEKYL